MTHARRILLATALEALALAAAWAIYTRRADVRLRDLERKYRR
jgi:hypothetical protein